MQNSYYLFSGGRLSRKDNSLCFHNKDEVATQPVRHLPVEGVSDLYVFGHLDANSKLFSFLGKKDIAVHFFDYYGHYTGSFQPKGSLQAGKVRIAQAKHYLEPARRLALARAFVEGACENMLRNLRYYVNRNKPVGDEIVQIEDLLARVPASFKVEELMGIEGNIRQVYYQAFDKLLTDWTMGGRSRRPPANPVNALISFGNMLCYTHCLDAIFQTALCPTMSFLHEPGERRFSLSLDLAEIFKPVLVDRLILRLLNRGEIRQEHFREDLKGCLLNDAGKKKYVAAWQERLDQSLQHRQLKRQVGYHELARFEAYKLVKHVLGMSTYKPFKARW